MGQAAALRVSATKPQPFAMIVTQRTLREHLRAASEAAARAEAALPAMPNIYAQRGITEAQFAQVKHNLLQNARRNLAAASEAALRSFEGAGLPGLPRASTDEAALQEGQTALASAWSNLAELATLRADKDASVDAYRKAVELAPDNMTAHTQLADMLESRHELDQAKVHAERVLRGNPKNFVAAMALARVLLRQEKFAEAERVATIASNAPQADVDDRALAWTLVGEARDRRGNAADAFKAFTQANQLMRQRYASMQQMNHPAHPTNVRRLTQFVLDAHVQDRTAAFATPAPAFLIGFPRSGTTLVEQVLASHPGVFCLGETDHLFSALSTVLRGGDLLQRVSALTHSEIETVRAAHRRLVVADHPQAGGRLIVDKHPLHIVLLPVINRVFPDAKIIFTQRDPRDVVLSCYQQCFGMNVATAQFLELERTAVYYDVVMEMMLTAKGKLPLDLLEVEYGALIADLEREARRMAEFLNLPFAPAMLRYDQTARQRAISSASARQVINPIYNRSLARWKRYARELKPVMPLLEEWARRLGYEA
ncbi:MAG: sulfotransferase [Terricaulis sp.]